MNYDVIIVGAGPGGIFSAYELVKKSSSLRIAVFEAGVPLKDRHCPIDGKKVKSCIKCKTCAIMNGFGGAGAFSDGKYNITNDFGGTLYEYIGKEQALDLMRYVDDINTSHGGEQTKMYSTAGTQFKKVCLQNKLKLLDASVRHLGTDINYVVWKTATVFIMENSLRIVRNASSPLEEAEASGWRRSATSLTSLPSPTVWISGYAWSFLPLSSHI